MKFRRINYYFDRYLTETVVCYLDNNSLNQSVGLNLLHESSELWGTYAIVKVASSLSCSSWYQLFETRFLSDFSW